MQQTTIIIIYWLALRLGIGGAWNIFRNWLFERSQGDDNQR